MYEKYFKQLKEECLIRNRSSRTAEAYISNIASFMKWTGNKPMEELCLQDAREFILFKEKVASRQLHVTFTILPLHFYINMYSIYLGIRMLFPECELMHDFQKSFHLMKWKR